MWNTFDESKEAIYKEYNEDNYFTSSGVCEAAAKAECERIFSENHSFARAKSMVIAYILEYCPIEICADDIFADKLQNYEIISTKLNACDLHHIKKEAVDAVKDSEILIKAGAIEPMTDFGHLAPDWAFLMENGIPGVIKRLEKYRDKYVDNEFYENSLRVYRAIIVYMKRLSDAALGIGNEKMRFLSDNLTALTRHAPKTLAQGMQLTFIIYALQTKLELSIVRSLGGLDRLYSSLYRSDIESGRFTDAMLREIIRYFYYRITTMKVTANMPFYICGRNSYDKDASNEFTHVLIEEYEKLDIYDPKIHVIYHKDIDKGILKKIIEMIKNGKNSFVFINADAASKALQGIGISEEDSKKVIVYGCYETASEGEELPSTCAGLINMPKILEMFLHGGYDIEKNLYTEKRPLGKYNDFDELLSDFYDYLKYCITVCMDTIKGYERHYGNIFTAPIMSGAFNSCVEKGTDIFSGGAKYNNTSIVCACLASVADSLIAVKKLVYTEKRAKLEELRNILSSNWENSHGLHERCKRAYPKFANNNDEVDAIASELCAYLADNVVNGYKNERGGIFRLGCFSIDWRFRYGKCTGALPDGHVLGEPLSKNMSATVGCDKNGVTAFLNSVLKIDSSKIPDGYVADVVLHSSCASGEEGTQAILGLITSYMEKGGFAIQFNVISEEILRKAQETPEKYRHLQIRVCGWNASFVSLSRAEQDEFIIQSVRT